MMKNSLLRLYSIVLTLAMLFCLSISAYAENDDSVMDCDVVVVGGGAAGLCSAIRAAQGGANVILIEKAGILGGNTNFAEGVFGSGSSLQKELGIEVDNAALLQKEMDFQNYKINRTLFENMISQSGENVEWLLSIGVKFLTVTNTGDGAKTWHLYDGEYGHGGNLVHALKNVADDLGITILLDTAGKELIMKDGKVAGIMAEKKDGSSLQINAKAAVLATGACK